ncbi:MAG: potassium-transporting ATPase subunit C [Legionella sp.]|nr:MAG: potassium-transporting ATPase subunit C [Legionella sp.]
MVKLLTQACRVLLLLSVITGWMYPMIITGLAQLFFPWQANGSLVSLHQNRVGSHWLGQNFDAEDYFWGRPSATADSAYNGLASGGSNWGPDNPDYLKWIHDRLTHFHESAQPIPVELITASGSGLDPDISSFAADYQVKRIADARQLSIDVVKRLVQEHTQYRTLSLLGEPRVNVLQLNLALDALRK